MSGVWRRLAGALFAVTGAVLLITLFLDLVPGDPIELMLGEQASPINRAELRHAVGLDLPPMVQLWHFLRDLFAGTLTTSLPPFQERVVPKLVHALPNTLLLAVSAMAIAIAIAVPLGVLAAARRDQLADRGAMLFAIVGASVPRFLLGPAVILLFAIKLGWLPVSGADGAANLVLPAFTLGTALAALLSRLVRGSMLEVLREEYVTVARAKGLPEWRVLFKHALRNALLPVLTVMGLEFGSLLGGAIITEKVFAWPGLGTLLLTAIEKRDYNLVRASVLAFTLAYVLVNLLTDLLHVGVDPRLRGRSG